MIDEVVVVVNESGKTGSPFSDPSRPVFEPTTDDGAATGAQHAAGPGVDDARQPLADRLAVVTGAGGLLGSSIAAELARRGARVCLIGRSTIELRHTIASMPEGARSAMLRCDLASADDVNSAADFIDRIGSPVDLLIHAAGLHADSTIVDGSVESLDEHYLLNVRGPYLLTQRLLGPLSDAGGQVVFFTSPSPSTRSAPGPAAGGDVHHTISQAGMLAFADELRIEASHRGVRVLSVETDGELVVDAVDVSLAGLARTVTDALSAPELDVTELRVRIVPHPSAPARQ